MKSLKRKTIITFCQTLWFLNLSIPVFGLPFLLSTAAGNGGHRTRGEEVKNHYKYFFSFNVIKCKNKQRQTHLDL